MSDTQLQPINVRPSLGDYLRELRDRREFMVYAPAAELRAINFHTVLGNLWLLLNPALSILVYYVIFGLLLDADRGTPNYIGFLTVGILVYGFLSSCVSGGSRAITNNLNLVRSVHFPRALLPLSNALRNFYEFLPSLLIMLLVAVLTGEPVMLRWLLLIVALGLALLMGAGLSLLMARYGNRYADLPSLLPFILRMGFCGSGILYEPSAFTDNRLVLRLFDLNPFYEITTIARSAVLEDHPISGLIWIGAICWSVGLFVVGLIAFWRAELTYGA